MEDPTRGETYRQNLAEDLKEVRMEGDNDLAKKILAEEKETTRYKMAKEEHIENRDIALQIEEILGKDFLTEENIKSGTVEIKVEKAEEVGVGRIEYEFEIENETRYVIEPRNIEDFDWKNHVIDTYDQSGRARIRIKNEKPRLSLKVPLFSKDTETSKACLRLEFKPVDKQQEEDLNRVKELILEEEGAQVSEKWGAQIEMGNGEKVWINRDSNGRWWIEVDEGVDFNPPEGIKILRVEKSTVKAAK